MKSIAAGQVMRVNPASDANAAGTKTSPDTHAL
jgi:hypothetical protein